MIAIAAATIRELTRRRFTLAAACATVALAGLTAWGFSHLHHLHDSHGRVVSELMIKSIASFMVILLAYAFSFILAFAAALVAAPMLSSEIESGVLLPVLARPISRAHIVVGKAAGSAIILIAYAVFSAAIEYAIVRLTTGYAPPHPVAAACALAVLPLVVLALTLAVASRLPMIAASIVAIVSFGVAWLAGIVASVGSAYANEGLVHAGTLTQLLMPTDALWRIAVYQLEPAVFVSQMHARNGWQGPFFVADPPPLAMELWTALWLIVVVTIAARSFSTRDV